MSQNQRPHTGVRQIIQGEGHQIAGNNIHNHVRVEERDPPENSPHLKSCKACGWRGVARNASECKKCGYDYASERAIAADQERKERERFCVGLGVAITCVVGGASLVRSFTSFSFSDALALSAVASVAIWAAWCWLRAWCSVRFKFLQKNRDN